MKPRLKAPAGAAKSPYGDWRDAIAPQMPIIYTPESLAVLAHKVYIVCATECSLEANERDAEEDGDGADPLPAREALTQEDPREQDCDGAEERRRHILALLGSSYEHIHEWRN